MAKNTFAPEVKAAMAETPADRARDKAAGIKEGSPADEKLDAMPANRGTTLSQGMQNARQPPMQRGPALNVPPPGAIPSDMHHVSAAAGIAHAILGNRGLR
jgi:hypothetical protein